jgi:hypothetical protein
MPEANNSARVNPNHDSTPFTRSLNSCEAEYRQGGEVYAGNGDESELRTLTDVSHVPMAPKLVHRSLPIGLDTTLDRLCLALNRQ